MTAEPVKNETIRLDKWLWVARFFKTRKLATDEVSGGKNHVNNQRSKPGKEVKPGTKLFISKDTYTWDITILAINKQRRPAKESALLYEETSDSKTNRHTQIAQRREERTLFEPAREHKPNKKQRRQIHRFKQN
jgi:ribosome-associated heat shock protein Hsp15